jgi:ribose transport system substrate-binding protein
MAGFMEGIEAFPGINILVVGDGQFNREAGFEAMSNILQAFPHIDGVYTQDDEAALGAIHAIELAGRTDVRVVTGFGGTQAAFEIYQMNDPEHIMRATMSYFPTMGAEGIRYAVRILSGETVPSEYFQPSFVVTHENVDQFLEFAY